MPVALARLPGRAHCRRQTHGALCHGVRGSRGTAAAGRSGAHAASWRGSLSRSRAPARVIRSERSGAHALHEYRGHAMSQGPTMLRRDIVVIGCSAGGVEALSRILQQLPTTLEAPIFVVQHMAATQTPHLAGVLARSTQLPVVWAEQGAPVEHGRVVIGPPDVHLVFAEDQRRPDRRRAREPLAALDRQAVSLRRRPPRQPGDRRAVDRHAG